MSAMQLPLALTQGDPAGIGPDITLLAWKKLRTDPSCAFFVVGAVGNLRARADHLGLDVPVTAIGSPGAAVTTFANALPVLEIDRSAQADSVPGSPTADHASFVIRSIEVAVRLVREFEAAAVVTNPIAKHVLYNAGFRHPGHTEFLAELCAAGTGAERIAPHPVMMLATESFRVVPVTVHVPLAEVSERLNTDLVLETCRIVARDMTTRFDCPSPRLALTGLNPHAGEQSSLGTEERDIIAPAVEQLRAEGVRVNGPLPADAMFHPAARATYDVAIAMYHDQALIPIKTIAFEDAVNVTLGLPIIRTSPDHGTAFDLAGTGKASPSSLIAAIRMARKLADTDQDPRPRK